ncbi:unnamed protein product [Lampetra planeri]
MSTPARCGTFHTPCNGAPLLMASKGVLVSVCSDDKLHMWSLRQHNPVLVHSLTPEPKASPTGPARGEPHGPNSEWRERAASGFTHRHGEGGTTTTGFFFFALPRRQHKATQSPQLDPC